MIFVADTAMPKRGAGDEADGVRFTNPLAEDGDDGLDAEDGDDGPDAQSEGLSEGPTDAQLKMAQYQLVVCGCGTRMTWYALNVAIAYFSDMYGNEMYPMLLLAYNVSATGLVLGQAALDKKLIARYGVRKLFTIRVNVALFLILGIAGTMPFVPEYYPGETGELLVLLLVFALGACDYLVSGTLTQISAQYGGSPAAVFTGNTLCGVFLLAYTLATGFGAHHEGAGVGHSHETLEHCIWYFAFSSSFTICAVLAFNGLWLGPVCTHVWPLDLDDREDSGDTTEVLELGISPAALKVAAAAAEDSDQAPEKQEKEQPGGSSSTSFTREELLHSPVAFTLMIEEGDLVDHKQKVVVEASSLAEVEAALAKELTLSRDVAAFSVCVGGELVTEIAKLPEKSRIQLQERDDDEEEVEVELSFNEIMAAEFNQESLLWRVGKNTWRLQLAQTLLWLACFGVQALFVVDAQVQQILVFENMFGFLIGQQLPDLLPMFVTPTQGRLLGPAAFMCSFVVVADLYVLGYVPPMGPVVVCAFVLVFEIALGALFMSFYKYACSDRVARADRGAATRLLNLTLQLGILLGLLHSYILQLYDEGSRNVDNANFVDLDGSESGMQNLLPGESLGGD